MESQSSLEAQPYIPKSHEGKIQNDSIADNLEKFQSKSLNMRNVLKEEGRGERRADGDSTSSRHRGDAYGGDREVLGRDMDTDRDREGVVSHRARAESSLSSSPSVSRGVAPPVAKTHIHTPIVLPPMTPTRADTLPHKVNTDTY